MGPGGTTSGFLSKGIIAGLNQNGFFDAGGTEHGSIGFVTNQKYQIYPTRDQEWQGENIDEDVEFANQGDSEQLMMEDTPLILDQQFNLEGDD